ncbi:UDP-galactose transporter [Sorochytrium milnesiophthora]
MYGEYLTCALGIYASFLSWGLLQERVASVEYNGAYFRSFVFLNTVQSATATVVGVLYLLIRKDSFGPMSLPVLKKYAMVAVLSSLASPFGYAALKYIDYPTMILGKSCKLLPVMAMSVLLHRRSFPRHQYLAVALVTVGVSAFMLLHDQETASTKKQASNSMWGLFLLSINLIVDGITNSTQDSIFKATRVTGQQMMVMMNALSTVLTTAYLLSPFSSNELSNAASFISGHPRITYDIMLFSLCGATGQVFIFHTLSRFGSLSLVTITVTRKMFSIILSVLQYDHHITTAQWAAVLVVFAGIAVEAYGKKPKPSSDRRSSSSSNSSSNSSRRTDNGHLHPSVMRKGNESPQLYSRSSSEADGALAAYFTVITDYLDTIVATLCPSAPVYTASAILAVMVVALIYPLSLSKNMSRLAFTSTLSLLGILYVVVLVPASYFVDQSKPSFTPPPVEKAMWGWDVLSAWSTMAMAFINHSNVIEIASELKPVRLPLSSILPTKVVAWTDADGGRAILAALSSLFIALVYALVSISGYLHYGAMVAPNVLNSEPLSPFFTVARIAIVTYGAVAIQVDPEDQLSVEDDIMSVMGSLSDIGEEEAVLKSVLVEHDYFAETAVPLKAVFIIALAYGLSVTLPGLNKILALTGAMSGSLVIYIFPALYYLNLTRAPSVHQRHRWLTVGAWLNIAVGSVLFLAGSFYALVDLRRQ